MNKVKSLAKSDQYNCVNVGNEERKYKKDNKNKKRQVMMYLSQGFGLAGKRVNQTITLNPGRFRPHHSYPKYNKIKTGKKHSKYKIQEHKEMKRQQVRMRRNKNKYEMTERKDQKKNPGQMESGQVESRQICRGHKLGRTEVLK